MKYEIWITGRCASYMVDYVHGASLSQARENARAWLGHDMFRLVEA